MFLAKVATIVVAIIIVVAAVASSGNKGKKGGRKGRIKVTRLNEHYDEMGDTLRQEVLDKDALKELHKHEKKEEKARKKAMKAQRKEQHAAIENGAADNNGEDQETAEKSLATSPQSQPPHENSGPRKKRVYVLNFMGDVAANAVDSLREEITTILTLAEDRDEVVVRLESPGGMVHAYGLASSQLSRIRNRKIPLTICVDKVAASGGYMMACLADKLVAAPFAIIGSIGVILQLPNFHRVLKKYDVDYEMISAGEFKRTVSTFGEITEKGRGKAQEDVEIIHELFKKWVKDHRPSIDIDKISTGETWVGMQAKERYMVDEIKTSDELITSACNDAEVFEVEFEVRKSIQDKLGSILEGAIEKVFLKWFGNSSNDKFFR